MKNAELETRVCTCGCARTFRVLPTSKQKVFSYYECASATPNKGRLEFENKSHRLTLALHQGQEVRHETKKRNTQGKRNWSKWDSDRPNGGRKPRS